MALIIEKTSRKLAFKDGKPTVHTLKCVRYQNVNNELLVEEIAQTQGITKTMAMAVVEAYINRLVHYMELGLGVQMGEFGIFKPTIQSKAAATAEELDQSNIVRKKILFYPGKQFRKMLKNISVKTVDEDGVIEDDNADNTSSGGSSSGSDNGSGSGDGSGDGGGTGGGGGNSFD